MKAAIKWHGGKNAFNGKLAKWIISLMPEHTHYVEPYFGGGAVLLHKNPEGISEVINDIHPDLMAFWACLKDEGQFGIMQRRLEATPFSEYEFDLERFPDSFYQPVDRAIAFFIRARQSRQGLMNDFATMTKNRTRRGMNEQVSAWLTAIEGLPEIHARMKRVAIRNAKALTVIQGEDGPNTCFYLDPPYLHSTRSSTGDYGYEMTEADHAELLQLISGIHGKFLLSGYRSPIYDSHAKNEGWNRHDFEIVNNASSKAKKDVKTECVWTNF